MPVPSTIADLDPVAANNSPPGTETAKGNVDNYLRAGFAFTKQLYTGAASLLGTVAGTNTITAVASPVPTSYTAGQSFNFTPAATNTGATTINISSLGAKNVFCNGAACTGGELQSGVPVVLFYDGTQFNIIGPFVGGKLKSALNEAAAVSIAAASTVNIGAAASNNITITGAVTINAFDTIAAGAKRTLTFSGASTLVYNATSMILPTSNNILTAAGDCAEFVSLGSGNWQCTKYTRRVGDVGFGSSLGDVSGSRSSGVTYTNSSGKTIVAYITFNSNAVANLISRINGSDVNTTGSAANTNVSHVLVIPPGATYIIAASAGTITIVSWKEIS